MRVQIPHAPMTHPVCRLTLILGLLLTALPAWARPDAMVITDDGRQLRLVEPANVDEVWVATGPTADIDPDRSRGLFVRRSGDALRIDARWYEPFWADGYVTVISDECGVWVTATTGWPCESQSAFFERTADLRGIWKDIVTTLMERAGIEVRRTK